MIVEKFRIEKSTRNDQRLILIAMADDGKEYVVSGDHFNPTYLVEYNQAFDTIS